MVALMVSSLVALLEMSLVEMKADQWAELSVVSKVDN